MKFEFDLKIKKIKDLLEFYLSGIEHEINN